MNNRTIQLNHIIFQFGIIALSISPIQVRLPVIINKDCRINVIPVDFSAFYRHIIGNQSRATCINKRA